MDSLSTITTAEALAAFAKGTASKRTLRAYVPRWKEWERWCAANGIDALNATHEDYLTYRAEANGSNFLEPMTRCAISYVYRHLGKANPALPAQGLSEQTTKDYQKCFRKFTAWCDSRGKPAMPAHTEDIAEFLKELARTYSKRNVEFARASIAWHHRREGYASPSTSTEVHRQIEVKSDNYQRKGISPTTARRRESDRATWQKWCLKQPVDPRRPTPEALADYIQHLGRRMLRSRLNGHLCAIREQLRDPDVAKTDKVEAALAAVPYTGPSPAPIPVATEQINTAIRDIIEMAFIRGRWKDQIPAYLGTQRAKRLKKAIMNSEVTPQTFRSYVTVGWLPFKRWCKDIGISIMEAQPGDLAAFLCDVADTISPYAARRTLDAMRYCYSLCRPEGNVAESKIALDAARGLARERPKATSQMDPINEVDLEAIKATAHQPRHSERPHHARLRGDVDVALAATMRDAMLRRAEAASALWKHITETPDGTGTLLIPRSKTDQLAKGADGHLSEETMGDLKRLRQTLRQEGAEPSEDDRIFGLSGSSIYERLKKACLQAGLKGRFGGHSPRIGMTQDLVAANISQPLIMIAARWKSGRMPAYYARRQLAANNAVAQYNRKTRKQENPKAPSPLSAYGLITSSKERRMGH